MKQLKYFLLLGGTFFLIAIITTLVFLRQEKITFSEETKNFLKQSITKPPLNQIVHDAKKIPDEEKPVTISFPLILQVMHHIMSLSEYKTFDPDEPTRFLETFHIKGLPFKVFAELLQQKPSHIAYWDLVSTDVDVVNKTLKDHGFSIQLKKVDDPIFSKFTPTYTALGCSMKAHWKNPGNEHPSLALDGFDKHRTKKKIKTFAMINSINTLYSKNETLDPHDNTVIIELPLEHKDGLEDLSVYIQQVDSPIKDETDLLLATLQAYKNIKIFKPIQESTEIIIPKVNLHAQGNCDIFKNLKVELCWVIESLMETLAEMDEHGFSFKTVIAVSYIEICPLPPKQQYLIKQPFILFVAPNISKEPCEAGDIDILTRIKLSCYIDKKSIVREP